MGSSSERKPLLSQANKDLSSTRKAAKKSSRRTSRFGSVNVVEEGLPINDVTERLYSQTDREQSLCNRLSYPVILLLGAVVFFGVLGIVYVVSPPQHRWQPHNEKCPAQERLCSDLMGHLSIEIQCTLAGTIFIVLTSTWLLEKPRRPLIRFIADNSKSVLLALVTHFLAGGSTILIDKVVKNEDVMACDWYFVIFVWDSFIGVTATITIHQWTAKKAERFDRFELLSRIGDYEARPHPITGFREDSTNKERIQRWGYQMLHWILSALVARVFDLGLLYFVAPWLGRVATGIGWWACSKSQVSAKQWLNILVMPILLDSFQFLVQNKFLKARKTQFHNGVSAIRSRRPSPADNL